MAAPRIVIVGGVGGGDGGDEEFGKIEDSPTSKKPRIEGKFPLNRGELFVATTVLSVFVFGLLFVFWRIPVSQYGNIKLPRTISDLQILKEKLAMYSKDHPTQFILGYCSTYIFMQTFMIPGTIFMSLLAGALFGVLRGLVLVVFNATAGASSCYFLSKLIGRPIVTWLWPEKLKFFQGEITKRKEKLLNYMLFLRVTPTLPNLFINLASPIVDIPFHIFFLATIVGIIPASFITVRAGLALGELKSVKDLYDFKTLAVLFLIGSVIIVPTVLKRKRTYE